MAVLSAAFWDYDRTLPLRDGRVGIDGYDLDVRISAPEATFRRALSGEAHISELSFSNSVTRLSRGDELPYVLLPVFLSRAFRHAMIHVRTDRGITEPRDLRGKAVGVQEYDMTAAVVVRGFLRDQFGIRPEDLNWKVGEADGGVTPALFADRPAGLSIDIHPPGFTLEERLLRGELDAILALRPSAGLTAAVNPVKRLFANPRDVERAWFAQSRIFPIMHLVGVRKDVVAADPALPAKVYEAFSAAKRLAVEELEVTQAQKVTLPWPAANVADARELMGRDYWSYGVSANREALESQLQWSWLDGLQKTRVPLEAIFHRSTYDT